MLCILWCRRLCTSRAIGGAAMRQRGPTARCIAMSSWMNKYLEPEPLGKPCTQSISCKVLELVPSRSCARPLQLVCVGRIERLCCSTSKRLRGVEYVN